MASSTTPTPPIPVAWTPSGACTSGSIELPKGATSRASGGAATTSTRGERRDRDVDAGRLDDVDDVDAAAGPDVARRRRRVPEHVGADDGGDDAAVARAHAVALPPGGGPRRPGTSRRTDRAGRAGLLRRLDRVGNGRVSDRRLPRHRRDGT